MQARNSQRRKSRSASKRRAEQGYVRTAADSSPGAHAATPDGDYVAGNVQAAPNFADVRWIASDQLRGPAFTGSNEQHYLAFWFTLAGDGSMMVGFSDAEIRRTRDVLLRTFGWGLVATIAIAMISSSSQ